MNTPNLSFVQELEQKYPIDTAFSGVAGEVHVIITSKTRGISAQESQLQLLENMMDVPLDGTGIVHGHQLAVLSHISTNIGFSRLLELGNSLKNVEHQMFFSRLLFSYLGHRRNKPDAAFEADMEDFGRFCQRAGKFDGRLTRDQFLAQSPAYYDLFVKNVA